jgi:hypothetical protein
MMFNLFCIPCGIGYMAESKNSKCPICKNIRPDISANDIKAALQTQAWLCPDCNDDHKIEAACTPKSTEKFMPAETDQSEIAKQYRNINEDLVYWQRRAYDTEVMLQRMINKVNMVTVTHRHQKTLTEGALFELYERQLLVEKFLEGLSK